VRGGRLSGAPRQAGQDLLCESEAFDLLEQVGELGIATPRRVLVRSPAELEDVDLERLPGERLVLKAVVPGVAHKTELGGVTVVSRSRRELVEAGGAMWRRLVARRPSALMLCELVEHDSCLGAELLVSARWTDDFGPVVTIGPGGTHAEYLARNLDGGYAASVLSPAVLQAQGAPAALAGKSFLSLVTEPYRGKPPVVDRDELLGLAGRLLELASREMPETLTEIEINPMVFRDGSPVALDVLVRLGKPAALAEAPRPISKLGRLLAPRSLAILGVSASMNPVSKNPGRIVLDNILDAGFDPEQIHLVKPGRESLLGCRCYPDIESLPRPVDLAVLCIAASDLPDAVERLVAARKAESLILIAGGLGESLGSEDMPRVLRRTIRASRGSGWGGPLVNGGNCLGVRSVPGRLDTLFIPRHKLSYPDVPSTPVALVSQSGAFAVARASHLADLNPRYIVSIGNQLDLTLGDYLEYLGREETLRVFAFYVEGFRPGDGRRWLEAAVKVVESGRTVVLYRAGRTPAGRRAAASHTASIAGDYVVSRELARAAGVLVADSLEEFEDLTRLACALDGRPFGGRRLGALSNAGFECVAIADGASGFELVDFAPETTRRLDDLFRRYRLETVVRARNPLDLTPILGDEAFAEAARLLLEDPNVDIGLIGCVPLTGALSTLEKGVGHGEDVGAEGAIARRLGRLWRETEKPWLAAVDGGRSYDALADILAEEGIPVFRSVDRALRLLGRYGGWRLRQATER
jgi:acyl-CoA synthetase (NDP forming)